MANEWLQSDPGQACYVGDDPGYSLVQDDLFVIGQVATVSFTLQGITGGKVRLESIAGKPEYDTNGDYSVTGVALQSSLMFTALNKTAVVFDGCITNVAVYEIPFYRIEDTAGNIIFEQTDQTGTTSANGYIQYEIDWTGIAEGTYKIVFNDGIIEYESYCLCLKTNTTCTLVLKWNNDTDAYGFNYTDLDFNPQVRVEGKIWKPNYPKQKETFVDNAGNGLILSSRTRKRYLMQLERLPQYIHDAIAIGLEHDHFYGNDVEYVDESEGYAPAWNNHSNLAVSETELYPKRQNLINSRCGGTIN
ncbi:MAG: hypothetical protein V4687_16115 [Bacteroidota bacterium]